MAVICILCLPFCASHCITVTPDIRPWRFNLEPSLYASNCTAWNKHGFFLFWFFVKR